MPPLRPRPGDPRRPEPLGPGRRDDPLVLRPQGPPRPELPPPRAVDPPDRQARGRREVGKLRQPRYRSSAPSRRATSRTHLIRPERPRDEEFHGGSATRWTTGTGPRARAGSRPSGSSATTTSAPTSAGRVRAEPHPGGLPRGREESSRPHPARAGAPRAPSSRSSTFRSPRSGDVGEPERHRDRRGLRADDSAGRTRRWTRPSSAPDLQGSRPRCRPRRRACDVRRRAGGDRRPGGTGPASATIPGSPAGSPVTSSPSAPSTSVVVRRGVPLLPHGHRAGGRKTRHVLTMSDGTRSHGARSSWRPASPTASSTPGCRTSSRAASSTAPPSPRRQPWPGTRCSSWRRQLGRAGSATPREVRRHVSLLVRGPTLAASMSEYLVAQMRATRNVEIVTGPGHRRPVGRRLAARGGRRTRRGGRVVPARGLFVLIGSTARRELARRGGRARPRRLHPHRQRRRPDRLRQTACSSAGKPGDIAIGDNRHGSVERVATAVGDGAAVVAAVHAHLAPRMMQ